jgi:hypothetical protein
MGTPATPGSEARTLYKAFIMNAAEVGKEVGLPFVDATGRLKGIVSVLQEIQNRFADFSKAGARFRAPPGAFARDDFDGVG